MDEINLKYCKRSADLKHNFAVTGQPCINGCGVSQSDLMPKKVEPTWAKVEPTPPPRGINNYNQEKAKEICDYFDDKEYKDFSRWIGLIYQKGLPTVESNFRYCKERGIKNAHYLLAMFRKKDINN